eukprot:XP_016662157.1 PREDICTED: uncharacterized protein LOC107884450 [Acyrthosiphon pisum]
MKSKKRINQKCSRVEKRLKVVQQNLDKVKSQMNQIEASSLNDLIIKSNLSDCDSNLVHEIFNAAKIKNKRQRRYSESWLLLCLLFHIRSPCGYKFLRDQNILPLPCVNTIRKYLSAFKNDCGFDLNFFKLLKKKMQNKTSHQKKGILLVDEILVERYQIEKV